ncbi:metal-dependent hydrolase [Kordia jejudonensis]|uniref:metal-dependent hydrolase n=1 Tax=Kordia jejudonensis TaxID=1348245 RepID=UPI00069A53C6|nr:metal-dependent hydrolase [Kordia jejudonensis]
MDSITQAVLGAAIGEVALGKKIGNKGAIAGAIVATIPDLDVILHLFYTKFEMLSIHRGYSHSIVCSIIGALLLTFILSKIKWFDQISFKRCLLFVWLCLITHMLLDAFTAYGTQLLLPFSDRRIGFDSINVVDPLYTIPMIIGLIASCWLYRSHKNRSKFTTYGLWISSIYLLCTLLHKEIVATTIAARFAKNNIHYTELLTMPVGIANINWYGVAKTNDSLYMCKYNGFSNTDEAITVFPINDQYLQEIDQHVATKMRWFAKGFYTVTKQHDTIRVYNLQVDMRGIVIEGNQKVPTVGYFKIVRQNGTFVFSSGSVQQQ